MKSTFCAFSLVLAFAGNAKADGAGLVVDYAERALSKGYGTTCSLSMVPSKSDGYYPCLDFGPYRYVREYQKVSAYVVGPDKKPFKVMGGTRADPRFSVGGPWEQDMAARMIAFWNDVVEGGAERATNAKQSSKERQDAETYIRKMMGDGGTEKPEIAQDSPVPQGNSATSTAAAPALIPHQDGASLAPLDVDENDIKEIMKKSNK